MQDNRGFTLIELILVITILGILAAIAIPKFTDLGKQARISVLQSLAGTLSTTANQIRLLCLASSARSGCDPEARNWINSIDGKYYWLAYGWPDSGDQLNNGQIDATITYSGFLAVLAADKASTRFELTGAPTPANCSVTYLDAWPTTSVPHDYAIQIDSSGC